jgi:hypothetical protein
MIISVSEESGSILAKVGVFYAGLITGCSCDEDPTPNSEYSEYCELQLEINKANADASARLLSGTAHNQ